MKKFKSGFILFAFTLAIYGCNSQVKTERNESHSAHESDYSESENMQLNQGKKWLVNEEMKPFILESETILNDYIKSNSSDFRTLAEQLKEKNSGLIKSCTMKGESHDELHKWLHPHMDLIKSLANEENAESAASVVKKLTESFETYHKYFQ